MNVNKFVKLKSDTKLINFNPLFFRNCLISFSYLITDFNFEKAKLEVSGREFSVLFSKNKAGVKIVYETGVLPQLYLIDKFGVAVATDQMKPELDSYSIRNNFQIHFRIQDVINKEYKSSKEYIAAISVVWNEHSEAAKKEIKECVKLLGINLKDKLPYLLEDF